MSLFSGESTTDLRSTSATYPAPGQKVQNSEVLSFPLTASSTTSALWIADNNYQIISVKTVFGTASSSGTINLETRNSGTAGGSGTAVLASAQALSGTANTVTTGTPKNIDTATISAGQILGQVIAGTMTSLANACVVVTLVRL